VDVRGGVRDRRLAFDAPLDGFRKLNPLEQCAQSVNYLSKSPHWLRRRTSFPITVDDPTMVVAINVRAETIDFLPIAPEVVPKVS
jgi:hypothetical protein